MEETRRITVVPAYGRDYHSDNDAMAAWFTGKDFRLKEVNGIPYTGSPYCSVRDFGETVMVRLVVNMGAHTVAFGNSLTPLDMSPGDIVRSYGIRYDKLYSDKRKYGRRLKFSRIHNIATAAYNKDRLEYAMKRALGKDTSLEINSGDRLNCNIVVKVPQEPQN